MDFSIVLRAILLMAWVPIISCASKVAPPPLQIVVDADRSGGCTVRLQGQSIDPERLYGKLKNLPRDQEVEVKGSNVNVPYRCIGGMIFAIQRAGVKPKFDFAAEPPMSNSPAQH